MAHEIGNLLGALQLRLQLVKQDAACQQAQGRSLEAMTRILNEVNDLVERVQELGLSGTSALLGNGESQTVDLHRVVADAIRVVGNGMRLKARRAGVELRVENALGRLPRVRGVPAEIRRTIVNLLLDARRTFPQGGTIRVVGRRVAGAVILGVEGGSRQSRSRKTAPTVRIEL